jgi:hypothetical protein
MIKPVCLMATKAREVSARIYQRYPYFHASLFERRMLFERRRPVALAPALSPEAADAGLARTKR